MTGITFLTIDNIFLKLMCKNHQSELTPRDETFSISNDHVLSEALKRIYIKDEKNCYNFQTLSKFFFLKDGNWRQIRM